MKTRYILVMAVLAAVLQTAIYASAETDSSSRKKQFGYAVSLYNRGMYERAEEIFSDIAEGEGDVEAAGYNVLCALKMRKPGYKAMTANYLDSYPYSSLASQVRYNYALNCFAEEDYTTASAEFEKLTRKDLYRTQMAQFYFSRAYCDFENGNYDRALSRFTEVTELTTPGDYEAPAHYFAGYILYSRQDFRAAEKHFTQSVRDARFREISNYYILECRFMCKDYNYVAANGPAMMNSVPADRRRQLSRLISESYLVLGDAGLARSYYDSGDTDEKKSDEDWFYAGSVLYAVQDWSGAAENFSRMQDKTDSLGQIASYHSASCYLHLKNKVAALDAFKTASESKANPVITEDAMYNYAKMAFDLNGDISVFENYLSIYSDKKRGDRVYSYIAVGFLQQRDYAAAVEAYDKIDELDDDMVSNYMKANYLRAKELIDGGSWRQAVPCLKAAAYYSDKREGFNQLSRFWLAEAYFRDGKYSDSRSVTNDLYNTSALYGTRESQLLPYNLAYCYFQEADYENAAKWFSEYIDSGAKIVRKESLVRRGDCYFLQKDYGSALSSYNAAAGEYPDVNDIYPYYQAALSYGLTGDNSMKLKTLSAVTGADPSSAFYPEALCELGVTYSRTGNNDKARSCFNQLISTTKDSTYISMALIELGTLSMKASDSDGALAYYRRVVEEMPLSHYTDDALAAMESVYRSQNDPQAYLDYLDSVGKSSVKSASEREEMIFNAAEQIFLSGNYAKALTALADYQEKYPDGARLSDSEFYIAESYRLTGQNESACDHYATVMESGSGSFLELATLRYSDLSYTLQNYTDAYTGYEKLLASAQIDENRHAARLGMMRSAYNGRMYYRSVTAADNVLSGGSLTAAEKTEATYIKGKSLMAVSKRSEALEVFSALAKDPSTAYGGEAAYILILDCYDRGEFSQVEDRVFAFSESSAPNQYWLAKSFVVLGDAYVEQGEYTQAKATFESVRDGYNPAVKDDVKDNLDARIRKTEEMINNQ